jgi:hypothetical protein
MTQAVVTRRDGDVFQARMFWLKAARLLDDEGNITSVGFESGPRGFDDIWVKYDPARAPKNQFGTSFTVERMQCKWHVTGGNYTYRDLTRPEFINAEKTSMLQRAHAAFTHDRQNRTLSRLALITNHRTHDDDPLHALVRMKSFSLDIDQLFKGKTTRSASFQVRKEWMDHIGVDEAEFRELCVCLGLVHTSESLDMLRDRLDDACRLAGLARPDPRSSTTIYDGNIFEWVGQRRMEFDRKTFREKCGDEGLLASPTASRRVYGIKTFEHPIDRLEDRCHEVLNLVSEFDDRFIRDSNSWKTRLQPQLKGFLSGLPTSDGRLTLAMDTHTSVAFAAGAVLDTKSGRLVEVVQRSPKPTIWAPDDAPVVPSWPAWDFEETLLNPDGKGTACAVSISRDTEPMVRLYGSKELPTLRRLLVAKLNVSAGQNVIVSGAHANRLAESLAEKLKRDREGNAEYLIEHIHLFVAAPNAFTFYLGKHVAVLKPVTLYEFDFARERTGSYEPSLSYP